MTLVYLAGAWLLGVAAAAMSGEVWWPGLAAIGAGGLAACLVMKRPYFLVIGVAASTLFLLGDLRYVDQQPPDARTGIALHNEAEPVRFRALVSDEPEIRGRSQRVQLAVREVFTDDAWEPESGGVLLHTRLYPRYEYGDVLELEAKLETPPAFPDFDYRDYLARKGIVSLASFPQEVKIIETDEGNAALRLIHSVRRQLGDALGQALPEPQAALAQGIFLGQRSAIPEDLNEAMNTTGVSHLIAISGHNVSLVTALMITSLAWLVGRRQAALVALVAIAGYTVLTGASPTVVRAAIMGGLFVIATLVGRPGSAGTSIALAAAVMTAWQPLVVQDVSFQLSFAAILGIVYLAPALQERATTFLQARGVETEEGGLPAFLVESSALTAAAVLATMPLFALYFDRVSIVTFAANLLLVPAFPLILGSSALTAAAGAVWAPLGQATGWLSWAVLTYMIEVARFFADVPLAALDIDGFGRLHVILSYAGLAALGWWLLQKPVDQELQYDPLEHASPAIRIRPAAVVMAGLIIASSFLWWNVLSGTDSRLSVTVLDVGQGDAILIESPAGHHVLIDGGADGRLLAERLGEELPFWKRSLDLVALTHPEEDHVAGLVEALERYDVAQVLATARESQSPTYQAWRDQLRAQTIDLIEARPGQQIALGGGATIRVLAPDDVALSAPDQNDSSLVLRLDYGRASFLLTGDIQASAERALLQSGVDLTATVLKVPHHGSRSSTTTEFVRAVQPAVSVISAGEENAYGHPSPTVLERLANTLVLRTDRHGTVRLSTDGARLWVETSR